MLLPIKAAAERQWDVGRVRRQEGGQDRGEPRVPERSSEQEIVRMNEIITVMQRKQKQAGEGAEKFKEERGGEEQNVASSRKPPSEGGEGGEHLERLKWRVYQLEKNKLELTSSHNQELCRLQAELTRLRSAVERGEAERVKLQYQLTVSQRDGERVFELTEQAAQLQQMVQELQKALEITRRAREEDQVALQQEVEERDGVILNFSSENQQLHRLLQNHEEALEESEQRMAEVQKQREKELEVNRRLAKELQFLKEREDKSRREKEVSDQRIKSLEANMEAERATHLETKFNTEVLQLRLGDLEAALAVEQSGQKVAQHSLDLLRAQLREVEQAYSLEREKSVSVEHALQQLQKDFAQCKSELTVALETEKKMTSDLAERLDDEKKQHANTHTLLEESRCEAEEVFKNISETLQQHNMMETGHPAKDGGKSLSADLLQLLKTTLSSFQDRLEAADCQVQGLVLASEKLHEENRSLQQLSSDQSKQIKEAQQASVMLQEQVACLRVERSDWLTQRRGLQVELESEKEEKIREREEQAAKVQKLTENLQKQSKTHLSFLYTVYQRLLAGCVLLDQPQSMMGTFTCDELCDVINEQVDQLTSDLRQANTKIIHLQSVCDKKSVCLHELQRSQECVLSRLGESLRRREEVWSSQHTHAMAMLQKELQACRSQCDSLRDQASSLELRNSSLTSDLAQLKGHLSRSRGEVSSLLAACTLLAGALRHTQCRLRLLIEQKVLLLRQLAERDALEEEVRRLAAALGNEEEEAGGKRRRAVRWWRRSVWAVLAVRKWRLLGRQTTLLFQVEVGGTRPAIGVCGGVAMVAHEDENGGSSGQFYSSGEGRPDVCARWLCSKRFSCDILSSMTSLQGALSHSGSSPLDLMSAARSALTRLLEHLLDQSSVAPTLCLRRPDRDILTLGLGRVTHPKALVSSLQQHFLLFSQRLHSAEVERRSLRLEVANLRRGLRQESEETVAADRFHSVCVELRQALCREQEAQMLVQEHTAQLHTLRCHLNTHTREQRDLQHTLSRTTQSLSELQQEVSQKERSLRILGKHLSGVQKKRKQLHERLQRAQDELGDAVRQRDFLMSNMKAAETRYNQVRESLLAQPHPLTSPWQHLEMSLGENPMGASEMAVWQSLLSSISQLCHSYGSRIDWLEQEVSTLRSHVTALRSELQDISLSDNGAFVPVSGFPERFTIVDTSLCPVPLSDSAKEQYLSLSPAPAAHTEPTSPHQNCIPASPCSKPHRAKTKERRAIRKSRGGPR